MYIKKIEEIISYNLSNRNMEKINMDGQLELCSKELLNSDTVMIVTGFVIKEKLIGETDGPLGAVSLAGVLNRLGKQIVIVTDKYSYNIVKGCCIESFLDIAIEVVNTSNTKLLCKNLIEKYKPSHIIGIERPGRAKNGCCYSMNGEDLSDIVPNTDHLFVEAKKIGIVTLAVGDGGNEVGMGKISSYIKKNVYKGEQICADVSSDYLIIAGVSNWGAHAIGAAISINVKNNLLHNEIIERRMLEKMIELGAVDGCTKLSTLTVDGLSLETNIKVLNELNIVIQDAV